jgi:predicted transcriptional regulator
LDETARITQEILSSILKGNNKVGDIRLETGLSPKTLSKYLRLLSKQGLIKVPKDCKRGKSKPCSITDAGIKWLVNIPLNENLEVLFKIADQLKKPNIREVFKNVQTYRVSRNTKITQNYFIERMLKGADKSSFELPDGIDLTDSDQPFREALKKILALHMYLISDPCQTPEEAERSIEKDFIVFAPKMRFLFSWNPGAFPELEYQLQKVDNYYRIESEKAKESVKDEWSSKETHLLGLERVDEKYYEEYLKTTSKKKREKALSKIENQVGWSVGKYLKELSIGKEAEITKYIDEKQRPFLSQFISLFANSRGTN